METPTSSSVFTRTSIGIRFYNNGGESSHYEIILTLNQGLLLDSPKVFPEKAEANMSSTLLVYAFLFIDQLILFKSLLVMLVLFYNNDHTL